jgi:hypothetical protein
MNYKLQIHHQIPIEKKFQWFLQDDLHQIKEKDTDLKHNNYLLEKIKVKYQIIIRHNK